MSENHLLKHLGKPNQDVVAMNNNPIEFTDIVGNGKWQIYLFLFITLAGFPPVWNHLAISFLAYPQDHWCSQPYMSNVTLKEWWDKGMPSISLKGKIQHSQCEMYEEMQHVSTENVSVISNITCKTWEFASDYKSIKQEWNLVCNNDWWISTSQSVYMMGFFFAALFSGQLSDVYGRRPLILFNIVVLLVAGLATAFSTSFMFFMISRFFVAFGNAGLNLTLFVLLIEAVGSQYRAQCSLLSNFGWNFGYLILPLLAWICHNWFFLQLAITIPSVLFISFYWLLPESPRWLLTTNKMDEAIEIMKAAASTNKKYPKDLENQVKILYDHIVKEKEVKKSATVLDLIRTPNLRKKTFFLYFIWMAISFSYYGLSLNTNDLQGDIFLNFFLSGLMDIPATLICIFTLDRFGRKKPFIITLILGGITCLCCIFMKEDWSYITTALALFGKLFVSASFGIVYVYSAEIFPTVVRNVGVGSCSTMGRIGSAIAPFMKDLGKITNPAVPVALFGILSIMSGIFVVFLPETKNAPLPETINQAEEFEMNGYAGTGSSKPRLSPN